MARGTGVSFPIKGSALLFLSGACALVYQTVWMRELRAIFGASTAATSAVLGIFMGALGVGAWLLGRRAEQSRRPLHLYGTIELAIAGLAAVSPFLLDAARAAYLGVGGSAALGIFALPVRLALAMLVMLAPAILMGGTLPAMARAITSEQDVSRKSLAIVYGINTLGAVVGTLGTTFVLFEVFGLRATLWMVACVNALLALVARALGRDAIVEAPSAPSSSSSPSSSSGHAHPAVLAAAFGAGFAFLLFELVWYRLLSPLLGGSTYSFTMVLTVALLGIGAGGTAYALRSTPPTWSSFGVSMVLEAVLLLGPLALGDELPFFVFSLREWGQVSFGTLVFSWFLVLGFVVFPAAFVSGYQFPLLIALRGTGASGVAVDAGVVYAANTIGAIAGSLFGGFLLLPTLGAWTAARAGALLLVVIGVAGLLRGRHVVLAAAAVAVVVPLAIATGPGPIWRTTAVGAGRAPLAAETRAAREGVARAFAASTVLVTDGIESGVAVNDGDGYSLLVNGKSDGNVISDAQTMVGATLLPALLHPRGVTKAFIIGLGTGQSAGWLAAVPSIERVDVAEIEPAVLDFAERCAVTNKDVMHNPKVRHLIGDGRELLQVSPDRYDVIMSEPSNPYRAGLAGFYTVDFYRQVDARLADDGMFAQWIQGYEVEARTVQMAIATMKQAFPAVSVWTLAYGDILLLATKQPQIVDVDVVRRRLQEEPYAEGFRRLFLFESAEQVLSLHIGNPALTTALAAGWTGGFNTDDLPLLEFAFARSVGRTISSPVRQLVRVSAVLGAEHPAVRGALDTEVVRAQRALRGVATGGSEFTNGYVLGSTREGDALAARVDRAIGSVLRPAVDVAAEDALLESIAPVLPTEAAALRLVRATRRGAPALEELRAFATLARTDPWLLPSLTPLVQEALVAAAAGKGEAAASLLREPFAGGRFGNARRDGLFAAWQGTTTEASCVGDFDRPLPWRRSVLEAAAACFRAHHAPDRVRSIEEDLARLRNDEPAPFVWVEGIAADRTEAVEAAAEAR